LKTDIELDSRAERRGRRKKAKSESEAAVLQGVESAEDGSQVQNVEVGLKRGLRKKSTHVEVVLDFERGDSLELLSMIKDRISENYRHISPLAS